MKRLGLIGGTSYHSTLEYYKAINAQVIAQTENNSNPELLLYSIPIDVMRRQQQDEINSVYLRVAQKLQEAGAEAIVICANTPHMAVEYVQPQIEIPFLHIGDSIGKEAVKQNYKSLLLLGNRPTITKAFLKDYLIENYDLKLIIPEEEAIEKSHYFVSNELTKGKFSKEAKTFYKELIKKHQHEIDAAILGCTELPILLKDESSTTPFIKTTDLHIQSAVEFIIN
ncbi:aspartate/glutamate racemase family protein [Psychroflexus sediminis]|uniref:Aspartate racemase n=1 Tax=Psychroflexus sediminis TaxID=470826 RepID=A0A1G7W6R7_9FLAO|nr:amino acid racemase [Psychroflexus sediminis]SDG67616.1 aspartate racemase [Psychroflexus sediminis]